MGTTYNSCCGAGSTLWVWQGWCHFNTLCPRVEKLSLNFLTFLNFNVNPKIGISHCRWFCRAPSIMLKISARCNLQNCASFHLTKKVGEIYTLSNTSGVLHTPKISSIFGMILISTPTYLTKIRHC